MPNILGVAGLGSRFQAAGATPAGFWTGLWHGLIYPISFLVSVFRPNVRIDETNNRGRWYDFGFIIGVSAACGGGGTRVVQ